MKCWSILKGSAAAFSIAVSFFDHADARTSTASSPASAQMGRTSDAETSESDAETSEMGGVAARNSATALDKYWWAAEVRQKHCGRLMKLTPPMSIDVPAKRFFRCHIAQTHGKSADISVGWMDAVRLVSGQTSRRPDLSLLEQLETDSPALIKPVITGCESGQSIISIAIVADHYRKKSVEGGGETISRFGPECAAYAKDLHYILIRACYVLPDYCRKSGMAMIASTIEWNSYRWR